MRRRNLARVARVIRDQPGVHLSEVVTRTGLASGSVTSLVNALVKAEVVHEEATKETAGRGRPRRTLALADRWADLVAVRLTRTGIEARATTLAGRVLASRGQESRSGWSTAAAAGAIAELIDDVLGDHRRPGGVPFCTVSLPGVSHGGKLGATELSWNDIPAAELLEPLHSRHRRIEIRNDGNLATLAEWRVGVAQGVKNAAVILLGRGLGGSAIIDGHLFHGNGSPYGFGHTPVNPAGPACVCGLHGCIELYSSLQALARRLGEASRLNEMTSSDYARELDERAKRAEPEVLLALHDAQDRLREFCDLIGALLTPDVIVVTGQSAVLAPYLITDRVGSAGIPVLHGALGADAAIIGATLAAQERALSNPLSLASVGVEE
ncbi:ROK family protein [Gryllotalpicola koreensis]|uniref:ROK family transcriptional regulator n=1 Tax=Gryllotalpicola koreensis TaxID=993086 RepID=A0ABP7ZRI3_9MICO